MAETFDRFFVVTGGPGSGKSSLIHALEAKGLARSQEAGRAIIKDQVAIGGGALPWLDPMAFAELMLSWEMRSYHLAKATKGPVIFDRGVPDIVGYLRLSELPVPPHAAAAGTLFRYNRLVFIASPWREIYRQDEERKQTFQEAQRTYEAMVQAYSELGYELVELPFDTVEARRDFMIERMPPIELLARTSGPGGGRGGG